TPLRLLTCSGVARQEQEGSPCVPSPIWPYASKPQADAKPFGAWRADIPPGRVPSASSTSTRTTANAGTRRRIRHLLDQGLLLLHTPAAYTAAQGVSVCVTAWGPARRAWR